jgi:hypothetical protein
MHYAAKALNHASNCLETNLLRVRIAAHLIGPLSSLIVKLLR